MTTYIMFDLNRYKLSSSIMTIIESPIDDILEFYKSHFDEDIFPEIDKVAEVTEDGCILTADMEEWGAYIIKQEKVEKVTF